MHFSPHRPFHQRKPPLPQNGNPLRVERQRLFNGAPVHLAAILRRPQPTVKLTQAFGLSPIREVLGVSGDGTINSDFEEIAFDELARSMGAHGERVSAPSELRPALERCLASGKPAVVHVDVDPMLHLMAPGLQEFKAMHQEPEG